MRRLREHRNSLFAKSRQGVILLLTLVVLVVLATLAYTLTSRVAARRHRYQYIINYSKARCACDSALKYAFVSLETVEPKLISRPNEPDFSDVFALSDAQYQKLIAEWITKNPNLASGLSSTPGKKTSPRTADANNIKDVNDANDVNDVNDVNEVGLGQEITDPNDPNLFVIRGPYGPSWPLIIEPLEFEIGSAKVRIEIEDENAKYPLGWALLDGEDITREAQAGFVTFCEWMGLKSDEIDSLMQELQKIRDLKPFKMEFKPLTASPVTTPAASSAPPTTSVRARRKAATATPPLQKKPISVSEQAARQYVDFSRLFHSSLVDTEAMARPTLVSETRKESALKYTGLWAAPKVNVNTAPRHVLEAAFTFGGLSDAPKIAEYIIQRRRVKPFENIEDLRKSLLSHSASIQKCEKFIAVTSSCFTVKVTVISGSAKVSAVAAVTKEGNKIKPIGVISD